MNKYTDTQFEKVMSFFNPVEGFDVKDYKSFSLIKLIKNGKYSVKLMYGYKDKHPLYGNTYEVDSLTMTLTIIEILDQFQDNKVSMTLDDLLDDSIPIQQAQDEPQPIVIDEPIDIPESTPQASREPISKPKKVSVFSKHGQAVKNLKENIKHKTSVNNVKSIEKEIKTKNAYIAQLELNGFGPDTDVHMEATDELNKLTGEIK